MQVNNPAAENPWKLEDIIGGILNKNWLITRNPKHENLAYLISIPHIFNMLPRRSVDLSDFIHDLHNIE
jgi:hypothetical protein